MTGPAQRGYVASASDTHNTVITNNGGPWQAFDGTITQVTTDGWVSPNSRYSNDAAGSTAVNGVANSFNGRDGEWLNIKLPHKITLSSFETFVRIDRDHEHPTSGYLYASNDGFATFQEIYSFTDVAVPGEVNGKVTHVIPSSHLSVNLIPYNEYRVQATKLEGASGLASIAELKLYGTEEASPVPIQIGGGNIDRVANFRVYDKFVEEDQALEIWDAQKDLFREVKNSMTLHKGRLGIGTTEPEGRLAILDEPHNLEEFPPRAMTDYKTYFEGHGEFCVSSGDPDPNDTWSSSTGLGVLFDKGNTQADTHYYRTSSSSFDSGTGYYTGSISIGGISGAWVRIDFPYRAKIQSMNILTRSDGYNGRAPRDGYLLGKNSDEDEWTIVHEWTEAFYYRFIERKFTIEASKYYSSYALVATRLLSAAVSDGTQSTNADRMNISEWKLFGTREQGQSVLHDGQLTLTKNLNVPRIGPALDADDTPRRDRLVVEYNTSTNPIFEGAVRDTSGRGNDGVLYDGAYYDTLEKTLDISAYNGSAPVGSQTAHIKSGILPGFTGNQAHTMSFWIKTGSDIEGSFVTLSPQSGEDNYKVSMIYYEPTNNRFKIVGWSNDFYVNVSISTGELYHITLTYEGATVETTTKKLYINGVQQTNTTTSSEGSAINFTDTIVCFGEFVGGGGEISGQISNFKLYDVALTASEVKTLYNMGRCDEGHHVVNFSKTRVGIGLGDGEAPTYTLDVRGQIRSQGSLVTSFTGQHKCVPEEPMETGLIVSAKKNQYVKLNGSLDTGKSAITIDESLPVVSLSNVVQDKACFGVVSSTEEANTVYRVETTNVV
jgi:hypothetical protein